MQFASNFFINNVKLINILYTLLIIKLLQTICRQTGIVMNKNGGGVDKR